MAPICPADKAATLAVGAPRSRSWQLAAVSTLLAAHRVLAADVWVVTDSQHSIRADAAVRVIELDAPARIKAQLAAHLPADPSRAAAIVAERLRQGGAPLQQSLAAAFQGVIDAWRLGISKIPAVVVDHRYVVYGESNVTRAVSWIEEYRRTQK